MGVRGVGWILLILVWGFACTPPPRSLPPPLSSSAPVVIRFTGGGSIGADYVRNAIATLGPVQRVAITRRPMFDAFLHDLAILYILARESEEGSPSQDPPIVDHGAAERDRLLVAAWIDAQVTRQGSISEVELRRFYDTHAGELQEGARVRFRQIVVARREEAEEERVRLVAGASFAVEARLHSIHPSASRGGEMGWHELAHLEPALREAVASLAPGDLSPVIASRFGYHILVVEARRPATPAPFEAVHDRIRRRLRASRRQDVARELIEAVERDHPFTVDPEAADRLYRTLPAMVPELLPP